MGDLKRNPGGGPGGNNRRGGYGLSGSGVIPCSVFDNPRRRRSFERCMRASYLQASNRFRPGAPFWRLGLVILVAVLVLSQKPDLAWAGGGDESSGGYPGPILPHPFLRQLCRWLPEHLEQAFHSRTIARHGVNIARAHGLFACARSGPAGLCWPRSVLPLSLIAILNPGHRLLTVLTKWRCDPASAASTLPGKSGSTDGFPAECCDAGIRGSPAASRRPEIPGRTGWPRVR